MTKRLKTEKTENQGTVPALVPTYDLTGGSGGGGRERRDGLFRETLILLVIIVATLCTPFLCSKSSFL